MNAPRGSDTFLARARQALDKIGSRVYFALLGTRDGDDYAFLPGYYLSGATFTSIGQWTAATAYVLGDFVRPTRANGFLYRCSVAGTTAGTEPTWPETAGDTVVDNTATWTCHTARPAAVLIAE